jgi:DNA (cytosine-5)-methyltransferase 1
MIARENQPTFVSLFCGCGGLDLGFQREGMRCVGAYDIDPIAVDNYRRNFRFQATVCDLTQNAISLPFGKVDVVIAGPPCQGFSTAGARRLDDPRNQLLVTAGRVALRFHPTVFVAENVAGAVAGDHKRYWNTLENILREAGYQTTTLIFRSDRLGLAQLRKRVVLIAWKNRHHCQIELPNVAPLTLREVLRGVESLADHVPVGLSNDSRLGKIALHIRQGQKLSNVRGGDRAVHTWDIPQVFGRTTAFERKVLGVIMKIRRTQRQRNTGDADPVSKTRLERHLGTSADRVLRELLKKEYVRRIGRRYDLRHTYNGKFRRLRWGDAALTVDTRFGDPHFFLHPAENRGFTVREAARIQGFPDTYQFSGSIRDQFRVIGNAVPPPVAECLARVVWEALLR